MKREFLINTDPRWMQWISNNPAAMIFHHPLWSSMLAECYGYSSFLFAMTDNLGSILAGLPMMQVDSRLTGRRVVALPFSDYCHPLFAGGYLDTLLLDINDWRQAQQLSEVIIHSPLVTAQFGQPGETFYVHSTRLKSCSDEVYDSFQPKTKRFISQAQRAEVIIRRGDSWEYMLTFYRMHLRTRQRQGVPVQPLRFFKLLWERLITKGLGFVLLAYRDKQPLAGAVFLHFNNTLTYKYGASDPAFWNLRPNHMIFSRAIQWGCEYGYGIFDWGKTDLENQGLRDFKRSWGSEEQISNYTIISDRPLAEKLTGGLRKRLLTTVIQRSPLWVCRAAGELLYGHFA